MVFQRLDWLAALHFPHPGYSLRGKRALNGEGGGRGGEGRVTRVNPIMHDYRLDVSHLLTRPSTQKDLGITISKDLKWNSNINQAIAC